MRETVVSRLCPSMLGQTDVLINTLTPRVVGRAIFSPILVELAVLVTNVWCHPGLVTVEILSLLLAHQET